MFLTSTGKHTTIARSATLGRSHHTSEGQRYQELKPPTHLKVPFNIEATPTPRTSALFPVKQPPGAHKHLVKLLLEYFQDILGLKLQKLHRTPFSRWNPKGWRVQRGFKIFLFEAPDLLGVGHLWVWRTNSRSFLEKLCSAARVTSQSSSFLLLEGASKTNCSWLTRCESNACFSPHAPLGTYFWHSAEIFNSLVLERKTLINAPRFPVRGFFSTRRGKRRHGYTACVSWRYFVQRTLEWKQISTI